MTFAIIAIIIGIFFLVSEVFLPTGGLMMVFSLFFIGAGVVLIFFTPESEGGGTRVGIYTIVGLLVLMPILAGAAFYVWPYTPMGKAVMLDRPTEEEAAVVTEAQQAFEGLRGLTGKTLTQHQPSGAIEIGGKRYDSKSEGMFLDAGQLVRVVSVIGTQLVVRPVTTREMDDLPSDLNL